MTNRKNEIDVLKLQDVILGVYEQISGYVLGDAEVLKKFQNDINDEEKKDKVKEVLQNVLGYVLELPGIDVISNILGFNSFVGGIINIFEEKKEGVAKIAEFYDNFIKTARKQVERKQKKLSRINKKIDRLNKREAKLKNLQNKIQNCNNKKAKRFFTKIVNSISNKINKQKTICTNKTKEINEVLNNLNISKITALKTTEEIKTEICNKYKIKEKEYENYENIVCAHYNTLQNKKIKEELKDMKKNCESYKKENNILKRIKGFVMSKKLEKTINNTKNINIAHARTI